MKKTLNNNQINKLRKEARKFYENLKDDPSFKCVILNVNRVSKNPLLFKANLTLKIS